MTSPLITLAALDIFSASVTHLWFQRHEPTSVKAYFIPFICFSIPSTAFALSVLPFWPNAILINNLVFTATLLVSTIWTTWIAFEGKLHVYHKELHRRYGPIARIGPNELSIIDADLIPAVLGINDMPKGPLWSERQITPSKERKHLKSSNLIGIRDLKRHAQLRKPWNRAFGPSPIKDYEEALISRGTQFIGQLEEVCKSDSKGIEHIDIAEYFTFFSFDYIEDIAFGGVFELLRDGDKSKLRENMENALVLPRILQHAPWTSSVIPSIPFLTGSMRSFGAFAVQQAVKRSKEPSKKDLFYHLVFLKFNNFSTFSSEEPEKAFPEDTPVSLDRLSSLELMNMIINETLRLQPAIPTSLRRAPAPGGGGKAIGSMFISEGTSIDIPLYALHRHPRYFSPDPEKFWPERWVELGPDIFTNRAAFIPFSYGPANCAGIPSALLELRFLTALLVRKFDMFFEDGYDPDQWEKDLKDRFALAKGKVPIKILLRGG
ncbi:hypothetical protein M422DRAFT_59510 [Sphaerobolus stellatus SS14]|nr:hypothetical protein M422DRAFT_59510 [Sphaerobolus stellatus SS14]